MTTLRDRLAVVEEHIASACHRSGRERRSVRLMAVSKTHPAEAICEAAEAGLRLFGENRVQEFEAKRSAVPADVEVHLIGHLQSNKAAKAAALFSAIDTADSLRLLERLNEAAKQLNRRLPLLLEIKLSAEVTKAGFDPARNELYETLERVPDFANVEVRGLMTIAPLDENPETTRACFRGLRELREELGRRYPHVSFVELSMGMSGDFEIAIEEGSTLVRIGTAIFGARDYSGQAN